MFLAIFQAYNNKIMCYGFILLLYPLPFFNGHFLFRVNVEMEGMTGLEYVLFFLGLFSEVLGEPVGDRALLRY